jgi:hypothetical protein
MIVNGNFRNTTCIFSESTPYYILDEYSQKNSCHIYEWYGFPELEIGLGSLYSSLLTDNQYVLDLSSNHNYCIKQTIPSLHVGKYFIHIQWIPRFIDHRSDI